MVSRKICRKCAYDRRSGALAPHCGYMTDTGRSRIAQMTPEQIRSGECPFFEAGKAKRTIVRPFIVSPDPLARLVHCEMRRKPVFTDDLFLTEYDSGKTDREIAEALGCAKDTVRLWRKRKELPPNGVSPKRRIDYGKVRALYMEGLSDRKIATAVGCSSGRVLDWRRAEGLPANYPPGKKNAPLSPAEPDSSPGGGAEGKRIAAQVCGLVRNDKENGGVNE